nr:hypothetical protein [Tanacetum cinerariifolium]
MIQSEPEESTQGYPLVGVEVLRCDKRSKSENIGIVPTEMELLLEQTQQVTHWFTLIVLSALRCSDNENMLSLMNLIHMCWMIHNYVGNPVKEILLKLNLPDHRTFKNGGEVTVIASSLSKSSSTKGDVLEGGGVPLNVTLSDCSIFMYCMEDLEQAFVEYASSHTDKAGGKNGSAFVQGEVYAKMEDLELFTLPCRLGDSKPFDTLANLGSCLNIIPLYLLKNLNIRLLEETYHIFGLANGTKSYPIRILKDAEVHIGKLELLNDFYVIDIKKDPETPLLTGRGFLATANAIIDCRMAKIAVGEGITMLVFSVKGVNLGEVEAPYWKHP